jgi:hypothetical protein
MEIEMARTIKVKIVLVMNIWGVISIEDLIGTVVLYFTYARVFIQLEIKKKFIFSINYPLIRQYTQ